MDEANTNQSENDDDREGGAHLEEISQEQQPPDVDRTEPLNISVEIFEVDDNNDDDDGETSGENVPPAIDEPPIVNMEIDLARIQEGMFSPVILLSDMSETQAVENQSEDPNAQELQEEQVQEAISDTPRSKKRKRNSLTPKQLPPAKPKCDDDDEDGTICSICLDQWTLTGDHRLVSLKCGHLFGRSCIKRWLQDNLVQNRSCATCKARAHVRDIRFIYAKSVRAVDNTREEELQRDLSIEKQKVLQLHSQLSTMNMELILQRQLTEGYQKKLKDMAEMHGCLGAGGTLGNKIGGPSARDLRAANYRLSLEKNIDICREQGCRAMEYAAKQKMLLISQKSTQALFPGFAIKFIQVPEFNPMAGTATLLVSPKSIRDITLDAENQLFAAATIEQTVKLFSIQNRSIYCTFTPDASSAPLWSCAFDPDRKKLLYLGSQKGSVYVYDIRSHDRVLEEFKIGHQSNDFTPIIKICPVEPTDTISCGGFLVCKLKSVWFYEYTAAQRVVPHLLNIEGTFSSMSYNRDSGMVLISVRPTAEKPSLQILASLEKLGTVYTLQYRHTFDGSRKQTVMYRSGQLNLNEATTMVVAYLEDIKMLTTWSTASGKRRLQSFPMSESIYDICTLHAASDQPFVAALSESKCRIYRVNAD